MMIKDSEQENINILPVSFQPPGDNGRGKDGNMDRRETHNPEGYPDPTAYVAIEHVTQEEQREKKRLDTLIFVLRYIIEAAGYDLVNRVILRDKHTGKEWR